MKKWHQGNKLPWQEPKPKSEDPKANELLKRLINSPSYRLAEEDPEFLRSYDARGVRLQLDYLKTEIGLKEAGIKHTIAIFGSARIQERKSALKHLKEVQKEFEKNPNDRKVLKKLKIAERLLEKSIFYDDARELGRIIGRSGKGPKDNTLVVMTGGGPGIMEAANRGAYDVGAISIGLNIQLPYEQFPNPYITPNLAFLFHYFSTRKFHFLQRSKAMVVYPGGYGTLDELFEALTLIQTQKIEPMPLILVGKDYWKRVVDFDFLIEEGVISIEDIDLFIIVDNAKEVWDTILNWYEKENKSLF